MYGVCEVAVGGIALRDSYDKQQEQEADCWPLACSCHAARGASAGRAQHRAQNPLVVGQVALALVLLVLLVSSGLMIRTSRRCGASSPALLRPSRSRRSESSRRTSPTPATFSSSNACSLRLESIPGVTSLGFTSALPLDEVVPAWNGIAVEGGNADLESSLRVYNYMSPGYLETMGIGFVAGRDLTWANLEETRPVTLVSAGLAREVCGSPESRWVGEFVGRRAVRGAKS
jgi:hypothetical protein